MIGGQAVADELRRAGVGVFREHRVIAALRRSMVIAWVAAMPEAKQRASSAPSSAASFSLSCRTVGLPERE
jgi:hypothetical protein